MPKHGDRAMEPTKAHPPADINAEAALPRADPANAGPLAGPAWEPAAGDRLEAHVISGDLDGKSRAASRPSGLVIVEHEP